MQFSREYCIVPDNLYPAKSIQKYVHLGVLRKYNGGETIVFPGEKINRVIYVVSGKVSLYLVEEEKQKLMFYACRHCLIDSLFSFKIFLSHIVAEENSTVCFFTKEQLFDIFRQDDEAHTDFITNMASKCGFFMHMAKEMDLYSTTARVLRFFRELCLTKGKCVNGVYEIEIRITQRTISEITGVHPVNVCKILGWLKKEKLLRKTPNKIIIYDLKRLNELTNTNITH